MRLVALALALAACPRAKPPPVVDPPIAVPAEGISIALYVTPAKTGGGLVDDRQWVEVTGGSIVLDRIDAAANLPALLVEPLDGKPMSLGACSRERIDPDLLEPPVPSLPKSPIPIKIEVALPPRAMSPVRCRITGAPGRRFVRVFHVAPSITFRINHAVMVTDQEGDDDRAVVTTRFAITTPAWSSKRAQVVLHDRPPGGARPPRVVAHGALVLDGAIAMLVNPEQTLRAHLRRVFDGAIRVPDVPATDPAWGRESKRAVQVVLDVEGLQVPAGPFDVRVTGANIQTRDLVVGGDAAEKLGSFTRLTLWSDDALHGLRRTVPEELTRSTGRRIVQRFHHSVSNASELPRDVWIEERLRPARRREITGVLPKPTIVDNIARIHVVVPPRGSQQMSMTITYEMKN